MIYIYIYIQYNPDKTILLNVIYARKRAVQDKEDNMFHSAAATDVEWRIIREIVLGIIVLTGF